MDSPHPPDFPAPAPVIIAGQQAIKNTDVSAPPNRTLTTQQSPSVSTTDSAPKTEENQHPEPTAGGGGVSLPPPPPKVASGRDSSGGGKEAAAGRGGGGGGYKPPSWGVTTAPDASGLSLTVLKGGIEVGNISLDNRTHILLGEFKLCGTMPRSAQCEREVIHCCGAAERALVARNRHGLLTV